MNVWKMPPCDSIVTSYLFSLVRTVINFDFKTEMLVKQLQLSKQQYCSANKLNHILNCFTFNKSKIKDTIVCDRDELGLWLLILIIKYLFIYVFLFSRISSWKFRQYRFITNSLQYLLFFVPCPFKN